MTTETMTPKEDLAALYPKAGELQYRAEYFKAMEAHARTELHQVNQLINDEHSRLAKEASATPAPADAST